MLTDLGFDPRSHAYSQEMMEHQEVGGVEALLPVEINHYKNNDIRYL